MGDRSVIMVSCDWVMRPALCFPFFRTTLLSLQESPPTSSDLSLLASSWRMVELLLTTTFRKVWAHPRFYHYIKERKRNLLGGHSQRCDLNTDFF